ncbi:uncharacterized protein LOC110452920 [Mizuhopecten yessoensis]|uniref:Protein Star n=1 Tax=Mizuhopecten yessoensis TaxID=6573 RepID=A0A210QII6_MIZYE|nr:uncharacterized protein LOC110452920 [Mizuhopecten yessoensis]XP_021357352.1 uncharacterized protein LOC110452920 [Mizuhopecten yessoensis]XP_021357353.1 uncharacterized protein LOC110452920 [Mizuhopecten yessoensis]OWF48557.1 Protein Star [Mizuhopecten yessoensis]
MRFSTPFLMVCMAAVVAIIVLMLQTVNQKSSGPPTIIINDNSNKDFSLPFNQQRRYVVGAQAFQPRGIVQSHNESYNYKEVLTKLNADHAAMDEPRLIEIIRNHFIVPPSKESYNLKNPDKLEYSNGQTPFIDSRLNYMEGGFYVECGALNGEQGSNTLFFEKVRKWNGLLVEADPSNHEVMMTKHRKAFTMHACLNPKPYPAVMTFNKAFNRGRVVHDQEAKNWIEKQNIKSDPVQVQCLPLYSILLALNQTTVDFFSLDVEGDELNVLKTIPFDKVNIKMLTVEYVHDTRRYSDLQTFMESKGYETLLRMQRDNGSVNDIIFRKKNLAH